MHDYVIIFKMAAWKRSRCEFTGNQQIVQDRHGSLSDLEGREPGVGSREWNQY
jgi:hypothetical protein